MMQGNTSQYTFALKKTKEKEKSIIITEGSLRLKADK